jgi:hypothetical protein
VNLAIPLILGEQQTRNKKTAQNEKEIDANVPVVQHAADECNCGSANAFGNIFGVRKYNGRHRHKP